MPEIDSQLSVQGLKKQTRFLLRRIHKDNLQEIQKVLIRQSNSENRARIILVLSFIAWAIEIRN